MEGSRADTGEGHGRLGKESSLEMAAGNGRLLQTGREEPTSNPSGHTWD